MGTENTTKTVIARTETRGPDGTVYELELAVPEGATPEATAKLAAEFFERAAYIARDLWAPAAPLHAGGPCTAPIRRD